MEKDQNHERISHEKKSKKYKHTYLPNRGRTQYPGTEVQAFG